MSVDTTAIIMRGFEIDKGTWNNLSWEFRDDWGVCFNDYHDEGPFVIGYRIQSCDVGILKPLHSNVCGDPHWDNLFAEACRVNNISIKSFTTYFGVMLS